MTETRTAERYCSQHRQPRSECRPDDRHAQPLRCSDELIARVEAKAKTLGLDKNGGIEAAMEAWVQDTRGDALAPVTADPLKRARARTRTPGRTPPAVFMEPGTARP